MGNLDLPLSLYISCAMFLYAPQFVTTISSAAANDFLSTSVAVIFGFLFCSLSVLTAVRSPLRWYERDLGQLEGRRAPAACQLHRAADEAVVVRAGAAALVLLRLADAGVARLRSSV